METVLLFIIGCISYFATAFLCYNAKNNSIPGLSTWWPFIGAVLGALTNALWFRVVWIAQNKEDVYLKGLQWDTMIVICYSILPVVLYNVRLTHTQWVGYGLVLVGMTILR